MAYRLIFNPLSCEFDYVNTSRLSGVYPVNYVNRTILTLPATGYSYAPDGINLVSGDLVLFTGLTNVLDRGVYKATVVGGLVTNWTRIVYGQSPIGESTDGDEIIVIYGDVYADHHFQCTDTPTATWLDLGIPATQIQSDWNQTNISSVDYIKNKPTILEEAPINSLTYARKDAEWTDISSLIFPKIVSWAGSESFDDLYTRCLPYLEHPLPIILHGDGHVISGVDEGGYRQASNMLLFSADPEGQKTVIIAGETFYFSRGFPQLLRGVKLINKLRRTILELDGTSVNWIIGEDCEIATEEGGSYFIAIVGESGTLNVYSRGKIGRQVFNDATALGSGRFTVDVYDGSEIEGQIVTTRNRETQLTFNIYAPALIGVQEGLGLIKNYFNTADELAFADAISGLVSTTTQDAIIETNTRVSSIIAGSVAHTSITTGALSVGTRRVTGNTTVTDTDCGIIADTTSQNITVTLPSAAGRVGRIIYITKSSANNTLTIMPFGTNKIIGESSLEIEDNYVTIALKASTLATWDLI